MPMLLKPTLSRWLLLCLLLLNVGCPHRSPIWSPDGKWVIVLAGAKGEEIDKAASQLWLVEAATGHSQRVAGPEPAVRFLAATWIDGGQLIAFTGSQGEDGLQPSSGRIWTLRVEPRGGKGLQCGPWKRVAAPEPSLERTSKRVPLVLKSGTDTRIAYPSGDEALVVVRLDTGKVVFALDSAELVGPGPKGGFLAYRPDDLTGGTELLALDASSKPLWKTRFSSLRRDIAARFGKKPVEIIFGETAGACLPLGKTEAEWVGINLMHADVGWREGISGYHVRLDAKSGKLLAAVHGVCLPGQPASAGGLAYAVTAPRAKTPVALTSFDLRSAGTAKSLPFPALKKEQVHGYSLDPTGKVLALSLNGPVTKIELYALPGFERLRTIELK